VSRYQKGKTNLDFIGARDSEWQWHQLGHMQICTSFQTNNHASTPPLSFLQAGCLICRPTNSVKALKANVKYVKYVHRLDVQGAVTQWTVNDAPVGLSVNAAHNVLVTCPRVRKIKEFSSHGDLLRELTLPDDVIWPLHSIQTRSGQFIVCHGNPDNPVNRVCMISADGRHIVHSHGGQRGSDTDQYDGPYHLAVNDNEFVFVADSDNRRVTLLSPTLEYVRQVVSRDQLKGAPWRLYLDTRQRLLYVAVNEDEEGEWRGYLAVFSV